MRNLLITLMFNLLLLLTMIILSLTARVRELRYYQWASEHRIPSCPEDATLTGKGEFENGVWFYYQCGPSVDDYDG